MLLLLVLFLAGLISATVAGAYMVQYLSLCKQAETAAEAASLAAARELSGLVVADPDYGYIALSDYAPSSQSLLAEDGKPLPVTGINTLLATARVSMLLARQLNNEEYLRLARIDAVRSRAAAARLVQGLKLALREDPAAPLGRDGRAVKPLQAARKAFADTLKGRHVGPVAIKEIKLELGYLQGGSTTTSAVPGPRNLAELPDSVVENGCYSAFVDVPVAGESFVFAAVGKQPRLVAREQFVADGRALTAEELAGQDLQTFIPSSIVRVSSKIEMLQQGKSDIYSSACAAPFALEDRSAAGVMIVGLPDGLPTGYHSLLDYINDPRSSRINLDMYRARGGDYPLDGQALLIRERGQTLANLFVQGLFDWVRTAHGRVDISALVSLLGSRMQPSMGSLALGQSLVYRFDRSGTVQVDGYMVSDVPMQIVHDGQAYTLGLGSLPSTNARWTVAFRDQVRHLGKDGGKHGGQLMEIDGCLRPAGSLYSKVLNSSHGEAERKSYFDGGLAVEFVISSPQAI